MTTLTIARKLVDASRMAGEQPYVHGNGFILLRVPSASPATSRLHFWGHCQIPRQSVYTGIHDHTFSFKSTVLKGMMCNLHLIPIVGVDHTLWKATPRHGHDTLLTKSRHTCDFVTLDFDTPHVGDSYTFERRRFHESLVYEPTITLMEKIEMDPDDLGPPYVAVRTGIEPDNKFDRHAFPAPMLWAIIEEMLGS